MDILEYLILCSFAIGITIGLFSIHDHTERGDRMVLASYLFLCVGFILDVIIISK